VREPLVLAALLVLCAAPAQSSTPGDTPGAPRAPTNEAVHMVHATATPLVRSLDGLAAYRCGDYAVFAGPTLATVRYWMQQGASPEQAAEMTSLGGADAFLAERAAQAPAAITQDDFRRQTLADCLNAAAER
jgi:hypothetical protein